MQKKYENCKYFGNINCPEKNNAMMKDVISKTPPLPIIPTDNTEGFMIGIKVNQLLCSTCKSFKKN